jgi:hypothetical protein
MTDAPTSEADIAVPHRGRGRPKDETVTLTKAARARFDTLAAESIEAVFQAVLTAATQDGDLAAAKLLIDRVIPSRGGAPVSFHIPPLKAPEDCALAYADPLDNAGPPPPYAGLRRRSTRLPSLVTPTPAGRTSARPCFFRC